MTSVFQTSALIIIAATNVYQLGVVLYLLLTGNRPFRAVTGRMSELEHAICEVPPQRPSLDRDLDQIVLKTLEKDPAQRYISAGDLADDLQRYLDGFAIEAHTASGLYRTGKFVLRNKLAVSAGTLVLLLLVGFSISTLL
jgi:serine/threonine protein kinase